MRAIIAGALLCGVNGCGGDEVASFVRGQDNDATTDTGSAGAPDDPRLEELDVLFIGNSYVSVNDVPDRTGALLADVASEVRVEVVAPGSYRLEQHALDAQADDTDLARLLRTGSADERSFDAVVLQEQSQLGGFLWTIPDRRASVAAAQELATLADEAGAAVVLYLTWGREHGDPANLSLDYGQFESMQDRLDAGYLTLAAHLRDRSIDVRVAPVGGGFRLVFEDVTNAGDDPLVEGSDFDALYDADGSHPSAQGAYLASCIIAGAISGEGVADFADAQDLASDISLRLRAVCARALADPRWQIPRSLTLEAELETADARVAGYGASVASSPDGERVFVGQPDPYSGTDSGRAYAFTRSAGGWMVDEIGRGEGLFGNFVSAVGAEQTFVGSPLRVFRDQGTAWTEDTNANVGMEDEVVLAVSADGQRVLSPRAAGAPDGQLARLFEREGNAWVETELVVDNPAQSGAYVELALDTVGQRVLVGARVNEGVDQQAIAYVLVRTASGWDEEARLVANAGASHVAVPRVALSADGAVAIVADWDNDLVVPFFRVGGAWTRGEPLSPPSEFVSDVFGRAVALSDDGQWAAVSAPGDARASSSSFGSVRVFERTVTGYEERFLIANPRPAYTPRWLTWPASMFGYALALNSDGSRIVVGAAREVDSIDGQPIGGAYVFERPPSAE